MYRVTYRQLMRILEKAGCQIAIKDIKQYDLVSVIDAIEIDVTVEDQGTEDESWSVSEFNIYTTNNKVFFGIMLKHDCDFNVSWAPTTPNPDYTVAVGTLQGLDRKLRKNLEFLQTRALDACEYLDKQDEKSKGYKEVDEAYAIIVDVLKNQTDRLNKARGKVGDFARYLADNYGDYDEEFKKRIDEIYEILKDEMYEILKGE